MLPGKLFLNRSRKKVRLLVVADDESHEDHDYYKHLKEVADLSSHIYEITCNITHSGKEGLELINSWQPTVILVDAHLSDINSCEVVTVGSKQEVPVVVVSDHRNAEIEESAISLGAKGYISKSDTPEDVETALAKIADLACDFQQEQ